VHQSVRKEEEMATSKGAKRTISEQTTHVKNAAATTKGKVKAATGKALGNRKLQAKGKLEEVKGKTKQAGQRVKESLDD
jgi:uncharacterized protein YjbJ (UPF0337 family)